MEDLDTILESIQNSATQSVCAIGPVGAERFIGPVGAKQYIGPVGLQNYIGPVGAQNYIGPVGATSVTKEYKM